MAPPAARPTALRQVALAAGNSLDETLAFWRDTLGLAPRARFDPPGIAFIVLGGVRLFFSAGAAPATVYLEVPNLLDGTTAASDHLLAPPAIVHVDVDGTFGPAGEAEWMAFLKDPAGNTIGLVARRPHNANVKDAP